MDTGRLNQKEFKEILDMFMKFNIESRIYFYPNYVRWQGDGKEIELTQSLIFGESISSGLIKSHIPYTGEPFGPVVIPVEAIKKLQRVLVKKEGLVTLNHVKDKGDYLQVQVGKIKHKMPIADVNLPIMLDNMLLSFRDKEIKHFPLEDIQDILTELGGEISTLTTDYDLHGVYITPTESYTANGLTMESYKMDLDLDTEIFMPFFATYMLNGLPEGEYFYHQTPEVGGGQSPDLYVVGPNIEFYFREWQSKDLFPLAGIRDMLSKPGVEIPLEDLQEISKWIKPNANILNIHFREGIATDASNEISLEISKIDANSVTIHASLLPKHQDFKRYQRAEILEDDLVRLSGHFLNKTIAGMVSE